MNKVIAIVGMCGSGKSVASDYYINKGYQKVYFGGVTMDELKRRGLEVNPENEKKIREELRNGAPNLEEQKDNSINFLKEQEEKKYTQDESRESSALDDSIII